MFRNKLPSLGRGLKDSFAEVKNKVAAAAERVQIPTALSDLTDKVTNGAAGLYTSGKDHASRLTDMTSEKLGHRAKLSRDSQPVFPAPKRRDYSSYAVVTERYRLREAVTLR
jgi:hypothetical protein